MLSSQSRSCSCQTGLLSLTPKAKNGSLCARNAGFILFTNLLNGFSVFINLFSLLAQNYIYTQVLIAKLEFVCLLHSSNKPATQIHTWFFRTSTDPSPSNQQYSVIHQRRAAASLSIINPAKGSPCDLSGVFLHTLALILIKNTQTNDDVCACMCECVYPHILTKAHSFDFLHADDIRCSYSFSLGLRLNSP